MYMWDCFQIFLKHWKWFFLFFFEIQSTSGTRIPKHISSWDMPTSTCHAIEVNDDKARGGARWSHWSSCLLLQQTIRESRVAHGGGVIDVHRLGLGLGVALFACVRVENYGPYGYVPWQLLRVGWWCDTSMHRWWHGMTTTGLVDDAQEETMT